MSEKRADPDRDLMLRIEARDADALGELYDRLGGRLLGLAQRVVGASGEAEDVVQEVFLFAWRAAASFDPSRGSVLTWLLIATRSRAIDRLRARRPASRPETRSIEELGEGPAGADDVEASSALRQWGSICRSAIGQLPADQRRALELAYFEGLTQEEIAARTSTPLGTVKTRVRLGLMKLREHLSSYQLSGTHGA
ncbi:MAG: sigma-70 family RNA polymerase sigma factor [Acidobacteriota bacterium]